MALTKEYRAAVELGIETDTLDITGAIVRRTTGFRLSEKTVEQMITKFIGDIEQKPPVFSALHVNGKRAYQLAREGVKVELESRRVTVQEIKILSIEDPLIELYIVCSKGTYIRSLARDIAHALGTVGYLRALTRTRVGHYSLQDADSMKQLERRLETFNR